MKSRAFRKVRPVELAVAAVATLLLVARGQIRPLDAQEALPSSVPDGMYAELPNTRADTLLPEASLLATDWLSQVNAYRASAGVGPVTENTTYSAGDALHARYCVKNGVVVHAEDPANPWYTPEGNAAGQSSNVAGTSNVNATDAFAVELWMTGPFHALGILDPRLLQSGFGSYREAIGGVQMAAALDVLRGLGSTPNATYPVAWPGNGASIPILASSFCPAGKACYSGSESPNPLTSCAGYVAPTGVPLTLQLGAGTVVPSVTGSSLTSNGVSLEECVFDQTTYVNPDPSSQSTGRSVLSSRSAIVMVPRQPMPQDANYTATITTNGKTYQWTFSVSASGPTPQTMPVLCTSCAGPPGAFAKTLPANGASGQSTSVSLTWGSSSGATSYQYCVDMINNNACDATWISVGSATSAAISGLGLGTTYYWQVRAVNGAGSTDANGGAWWNFTTQVPTIKLAADFNGDGHNDLVWRNYATGQNTVWFMNDAQFLGSASLPDVPDTGWKLAVAADVNNDGKGDLVWHHVVTGQTLVWLMNGTAVASTVALPTVADPSWTIDGAADLNNDGTRDLLWRNTVTGQRAVWYLVNGALASTDGLPSLIDGSWQVAAAADMDGDGAVDLVERQDATGLNRLANLDGSVKASLTAVTDRNWVIAATVDFDGDQRPDLVWRNTATGQNVIWHMNGATVRNVMALPTLSDPNWRAAQQLRRREPTDLNSDGAPDLVWRNAGTGDNVLWHMDGATVINVVALPPVANTNWTLAAVADFNRDGSPDFVWRNQATGDNVLWLMTDTTVLQTMSLPPVATLSWTLAGAADLNGDGFPDLLWRNTVTGDNVVWYMSGTVVASTAAVTTVSDTNWKLVATADVNRDNQPDLIWRHSVTGQNVVWFMTGAAIASTAPLPTVADTSWTLVQATDLNGDGAPDLIWRNSTTGQNVAWYMSGTTVLSTVGLMQVSDTQWHIAR